MRFGTRSKIWSMSYSKANATIGLYLRKYIARIFRKVAVDELPYYDSECRDWIKDYFYALKWYEVYDLIELIVQNYTVQYTSFRRENVDKMFNLIFEREMSGYRFIAGILAPISNPAETTEISGAIELTSRTGLDGARTIFRLR